MTSLVSRGTLAALLLLPACAASEPAGPLAVAAAATTQEPPLSPSPLGHYLAGRHAQAQRDLARAAEFMAFALGDDPDNLDLMEYTYVLMASEGRQDEAVRLARGLDARSTTIATADLTLALDAVTRGDLAAADARLAEMPIDGMKRFVGPLLRAWIAREREGIEAALRQLAPLSEVKGFEPLYHLHRGLLNELSDRPGEAEAGYRAAATALAQPSLRLVEIFGDFLRRQGRIDEARALYREFEAANRGTAVVEPLLRALDAGGGALPPVVGTLQEGLAEALFNLATILYQEDAGDLALLYVRMALDLRQEFPIARMLLGDILTAQERVDEAIEIYRTVAPDSVLGWQARLNIARDLDAIDRSEEAIEMLRAMSEERPERYDAPIRLGNLLRSHERFAEAAAAYELAVERIGAPKPEHWSVLYFRGIARERSDQWALAEADFLKALELEPDQPYVMNYLAYSWVEKGMNYDRALAMLQRAVDLRPDDGYIVDSLGWVLYRLGKYDGAVEHLERAIELKPQDPVINDHLGDAYWKVGRHNEARFQWKRALHFEPEADDVATIQGKIERGLASNSASGS